MPLKELEEFDEIGLRHLYRTACRIVDKRQSPCPNLIISRLGISFTAASALLDTMETEGLLKKIRVIVPSGLWLEHRGDKLGAKISTDFQPDLSPEILR